MASDEVTRLRAMRLGGAADAIARLRTQLSAWRDTDRIPVETIVQMVNNLAKELGVGAVSAPTDDHS